MKLRYGDRVTVDWLDANLPSIDGWITLDDLSLVERGMTVLTTGYVIDRREGVLRLAQNVSGDLASGIIDIPDRTITAIRRDET
jgi:hypothetical protein